MATNNPLEPWQEPLSTLTTVPASKVLEAAEVIRGIAGSWAASYVLDAGLREENFNTDNRFPNPQQIKTSRLGQPGHPEINFVPYNFRTNRFGAKGGSFLGHPISFEIVGPTLKSAGASGNANDVYWKWNVTNNSGSANGDYLDIVASGGATLADVYNLGALSHYPGGLYVVVSMTAADGPFTMGGGVGDGALQTVGSDPLEAKRDSSKFEIFRVTSIPSATRLVLDPAKRLVDHFTFPSDPNGVVRALTLLQPKATRLVAIPEPGVTRGHEKTFAVVPPARALNGDEQYPYQVWTTAPTWVEYWLRDPNVIIDLSMGAGDSFGYRYPQALPIPKPKGQSTFYLNGGAPIFGLAGQMTLVDVSVDADVGDIIRVYDVQVRGTTGLNRNGQDRGATLNSLVGWFEIVSQGGGKTTVRRMVEVDPETGRTFFGSHEALTADAVPSDTNHIKLMCTVHDPITALWKNAATASFFDIDALESARLTNLIDPRWVERSAKLAHDLVGVSSARSDRAIFNTRGTGAANGNENPGSLLDLGFRMVLFPAIAGTEDDPGGGPAISITVPDFSRPITSHELILDPSKPNEKQFVEIDYANGLVRFSHAPQSGSDVWPTSTGTDNPRGELVLFASCVPYSMEEGQLGAGFRATHSVANPTDCVPGLPQGSPDQADVFSTRLSVPLSATPAQTFGSMRSGALGQIRLSGWVADQIPLAGLVEVLQGTSAQGAPGLDGTIGGLTCRGSLYGYDGLEETIVAGRHVTYLKNCFGGGDAADSITVDTDNPALVVWRREFLLPQSSVDGTVGIDYQFDTTYGAAKRNTTLRFEYSDLKANSDGSVSVLSKDPVTASHTDLFDDLFRSWLIDGGVVGTPTPVLGTYFVDVTSAVILKDGVRQVVPKATVSFPVPGAETNYYIKYSGDGRTECVVCGYETALPLDSEEDILLALVHVTFPGLVVTVTDLRRPLRDLDQRVDVYVGARARGVWAGYTPHFKLLSDAINFINEIGNPSSGAGVQQFRVFVVGPVDQEDGYPILLKTDGVLFESATKTSGTRLPEICWGSASKASLRAPLIDLNGHSDITFRGLSFRYLWDVAHGTVPTAADTGGTFVLAATGTACDNILVDNCRIMGLCDGLLTATDATTLSHWSISQNVGTELITSGIYVHNPASMVHSRIKDNVFWAHVATDGFAISDIEDGISITSGTYDHRSLILENNDILRFKAGLRVQAAGALVGSEASMGASSIEGNRIQQSRNEAISASGLFNKISGNFAYDAYREAPAAPGTTWSRGILFTQIASLPYFTTLVEQNTVIMSNAWTPGVGFKGAALYLAGAYFSARGASGRIIARGNDAWGINLGYTPLSMAPSILAGQDNVLESSSSYWILWGQGHRVINNTMPQMDMNYDDFRWFTTAPASPRLAGKQNVVVGNVFGLADGDPGRVIIPENTIFKDNWCHVGEDGTPGTGLYLLDQCYLSGNYIYLLKEQVDWPAGYAATPEKLTFVGNRIALMGETALGAVDGVFVGGNGNIWSANNIHAPVADIRSATSTTFVGNRYEPSGALGGTLSLSGNTMVVAENHLITDKAPVTLTVTGSYCTLTGNQAPNGVSGGAHNPATFQLVGSFGTVTGNNCTFLDVNGSFNEVTGNQAIHSTFSDGEIYVHGGSYATVTGNYTDYLRVTNPNSTVTGNQTGHDASVVGLLISATDCTVQGNRVRGNLDADPGTSGNVILMGNRVSVGDVSTGHIRVHHASTGPSSPDAILMGNWATGEIQYWDTDTSTSTVPPAASHWVAEGNHATKVFTVVPAGATYPAVPANNNIN